LSPNASCGANAESSASSRANVTLYRHTSRGAR
jgi:hypothetical protein